MHPTETTASAIRPEVELLLRITRTEIAPEGVSRIRALLRGGIDWGGLLRIARLHGVIPLLYWHLHTNCLQDVPEAALKQLRGYFYANAAQVVFLTAELCSLLHLLENQGIPAVPFKGPILAASLYRHTFLRQAGDLDILIRKHDALKARDVLLHTEYLPRPNLSKDQIATEFKSSYGYGFVRKDGRVLVELQWDVTRSFLSSLIDTEGLWGRLREATLDGKTVPNLSAEDLLLVLCAHGAKHCWIQLRWICDVAELVRGEALDWEWVLDQASRRNGMRMLSLGLLLANDLFGVELPQKVLRRIQRDRGAKWLARGVRDRFFQGTQDAGWSLNPTPTYATFFQMKSRERMRDKIRFLFFYLATPHVKDQNLLPLPRGLSFIHYATRPIRLIGKYGISKMEKLLQFNLTSIQTPHRGRERPKEAPGKPLA